MALLHWVGPQVYLWSIFMPVLHSLGGSRHNIWFLEICQDLHYGSEMVSLANIPKTVFWSCWVSLSLSLESINSRSLIILQLSISCCIFFFLVCLFCWRRCVKISVTLSISFSVLFISASWILRCVSSWSYNRLTESHHEIILLLQIVPFCLEG